MNALNPNAPTPAEVTTTPPIIQTWIQVRRRRSAWMTGMSSAPAVVVKCRIHRCVAMLGEHDASGTPVGGGGLAYHVAHALEVIDELTHRLRGHVGSPGKAEGGCPCPGIGDAALMISDTVLHFGYNAIATTGLGVAFVYVLRIRQRRLSRGS